MLQDWAKEISYCSFCPKLCKLACPVAVGTGREETTPTSKVQFAYFYLTGAHDLDSIEYNKIFYYCTTCTACTDYCDHEIDVSSILLEARREVASKGVIPPEVVRIRDSVLNFKGSPYGELLDVRDKVKKFYLTEAQVVVFPGYTVLKEYPSLLERFFSIMQELKIDYVSVFKEFSSSGYPLYTLGFNQEFSNFARDLYKFLSGYKLIITLDPADAWVFRNLYPQYGLDLAPRVKTIDEFISDNIDILKNLMKKPPFESYSYHDPCYLGRYTGLFDLPRKILALIFKREREIPWSKKDSFCCGRGGMLFLTDPEISKEVAEERKRHFRDSEIVVTSCPGGVIQLRGVGKRQKVWHIVDAIYYALEGRDE